MTRVKGSAYWTTVGCVLWLVGFDVVPLAHIVFHEALEEHHHEHDQGSHHHGDEAPVPAEHGEGSVAHRDSAAHVLPPGVPNVLEALFAWSAVAVPAPDERPGDPQPRATRARAPPGFKT